jgi:VWFA-related protein
MRHFCSFAAALLLAAGGFGLYAQQSAGQVALHVVAVDSSGQPVPDLTASDFKVFDNGAPQQIVSVKLNQSDGPRALVVLFDLLNSDFSSRGAVWEAMKTSLSQLPAHNPLYLYLLVEDGSLYAVHDLKAPANDAWTENIGPLLDAAMHQTSQLMPQDFRSSSPVRIPARFTTTCQALEDMRARMAALAGPKELLWVTYGFPSSIHFADRGWWDGGPTLRQLGARFAQSGITIYTADPGMNLGRGILNRDALDILTGAAGGRTFATIDLNQAIAQAEADARMNYSLSYQPSSWDGKYHKLRVTVARKGIHLQTERGYFAVQGS